MNDCVAEKGCVAVKDCVAENDSVAKVSDSSWVGSVSDGIIESLAKINASCHAYSSLYAPSPYAAAAGEVQ